MKPPVIRKSKITELVLHNPGITTLDIADHFKVSAAYARWAILECHILEFYDGNHVRFKGGSQPE